MGRGVGGCEGATPSSTHPLVRHCNTLWGCCNIADIEGVGEGAGERLYGGLVEEDEVLFSLQHTAVHCSTLQHTAAHCNLRCISHCNKFCNTLCNTQQNTHCNTHCNTLQPTATYCDILQHDATHCNNTACAQQKTEEGLKQTHCITQFNTLQHTATPSWRHTKGLLVDAGPLWRRQNSAALCSTVSFGYRAAQ